VINLTYIQYLLSMLDSLKIINKIIKIKQIKIN